MNRLFFFLFISDILSEVHIWEPPALRQIYTKRQLQYTIANFGQVPYGHSVYGTVFKSIPLDACNDMQPLSWDKNLGTLIVYVERGNCHFAQKVLNAQKIGAGLVIIGDTNNEDVHKVLPIERTSNIMEKIKVPSILIQKEDADNLKKVLDSQQLQNIILAIHFPLVKSNDVATIRMILQVDDFRSYDSVIAFAKYKEIFNDSMNLSIHYKIYKNVDIVYNPENCQKDDDITYCIFPTTSKSKNLGLLNETVRQLCVLSKDWKYYINYIKQIRKDCFETEDVVDNFKECSEKTFKQLFNSETAVQSCFAITSDITKQILMDNNDNIKYYLINYSPIVFINGYMYKGNYNDSNHLIEAFCNSFEEAPQKCQNLEAFQQYNDFSSYGILKFIFISIIITLGVIVILVSLFYYFYRIKINSNFKVELNSKVQEALNKYHEDKSRGYSGI